MSLAHMFSLHNGAVHAVFASEECVMNKNCVLCTDTRVFCVRYASVTVLGMLAQRNYSINTSRWQQPFKQKQAYIFPQCATANTAVVDHRSMLH